MAKPKPVAAAEPDLGELCELCHTPGLLCTLPFQRGKHRLVCIMCLAQAIQALTGWKMVRVIETYIKSTLRGQALKRTWAEIRANELRREMEDAVSGSDSVTV